MARLSSKRRLKIQKKRGVIVFRQCDKCEDPIEHSYILSGKDGVGEYCSPKCRKDGEAELKSQEKEQRKVNRKEKKSMPSKSKKSSSSSEEPSKSKSASSESASRSSSSESSSKSSEKKGKKMPKKEKKSSKKESKKEKKSSKKSEKSSKEKKSSKKTAGNYRAGSTIGILYERLSTGKTQDFKSLFKGIKGDTTKPLNRLERHGKRSGQWSLTVDKDNSTAKMKMAGKKK